MNNVRLFVLKHYILLLAILLLAYTAKTNWSDGQWQNVIEADATGYYAYLPAVFIYNDLNFDFYNQTGFQKNNDKNSEYDYRVLFEGDTINKYYSGVSILLIPFFILAHFTSMILASSGDGYSQVYVIAITIAALFYLILGLIFLKRILRDLFKVGEVNTMVVVLSIILGTNLFYYSIAEVGMSHVYSFSMFCAFIWYIGSYFRTLKAKYLLYGGLILGLIILIRPVNALIVLSIPFLSRDKAALIAGVKKYFRGWQYPLTTIGIVTIILSIQPLIYYIQTGSPFIYSYMEEGFNFSSPNFINFLFSYKKGFFIYTPISLLSLFGLVYLWKTKFQFINIVGYLLVVVYILSSWWNWYYGGSFSSRVMVEYLPFFGILLGLLLKGLARLWVRIICLSMLVILISINQIQTLQYRYYVIHWSNMDKERYWEVFLDLKPVLDRRQEVDEDI